MPALTMPTLVSLERELVGQASVGENRPSMFTPSPHFKMKYLREKKIYGFLMRSEDVARSSVLKNEFTGPVAGQARPPRPPRGFQALGIGS